MGRVPARFRSVPDPSSVRGVRRLLTLGLLLACACQRGAQVEALPLPDAEPPVIVVGPKPDAGKTGKTKRVDAGSTRGRDAAAELRDVAFLAEYRRHDRDQRAVVAEYKRKVLAKGILGNF